METKLLTLADVARLLNAKPSRIKYAIEQYRIEPRQRAGIIRLWAVDDLPTIRSAMLRIESRRGGAV